MSSVGQSALAQADKMGNYYLHGYYNRRPAYQARISKLLEDVFVAKIAYGETTALNCSRQCLTGN